MARTAAFETNVDRYDQWFVRHDAAYFSELTAVRRLLPSRGLGVEIGVGTGRFAAALGIPVGVDPSVGMLRRARSRDLIVTCGIAEALPFSDHAFDYCLIVTTICFVDDPRIMLREARRVLKPYGSLVIGFIDRESPLGRHYLDQQSNNVFYREATFYSARDVESLLMETGFGGLRWVQTLFEEPPKANTIEETRSGHGEGSFVAVRAASP
jgi:ubiquinone/menaquinone biosynthesis C-methylase UbiE